ncbi:MAG: hypothetical protein ACXV4A_06230 [Actinomycetes bacterium]
MLLLLTVLTAGYFAGVLWVRWSRRRLIAPLPLPALPAEDRPPASAVGWPPEGSRFTRYVDEGFAALDAYLEEGFAA